MVIESCLGDCGEDFKSESTIKSYDSSGMQVFGCDMRDQLIVLLREKFEMGSSLVSFSLGGLASPPWTGSTAHSLKIGGS